VSGIYAKVRQKFHLSPLFKFPEPALHATNHRYLYEPPGNVRLAKGVGGRYGSRQPWLIDAQQIQQGAS
ncbi:hypothetical protein GOD47_33295, partial [Sinorhizobium medicae]|nr:hypothetical protein [Sinorhizobium medicae]MDX0729603.1 hypothetical protein [Sinorhizobium medicae]MDX0735834.1 hypothetical protein [Sinorhizobium medicae]MDX0815830.1 hypothetical protein [Sinorhizobium medicae]